MNVTVRDVLVAIGFPFWLVIFSGILVAALFYGVYFMVVDCIAVVWQFLKEVPSGLLEVIAEQWHVYRRNLGVIPDTTDYSHVN